MCLSQPQPTQSRTKTSGAETMDSFRTPIRLLPSPSWQQANKMSTMTISPLVQPRPRDDSAIFSPDKATAKPSNMNDIFDDPPWDTTEPKTWPVLFLPFHDTPSTSRPMHIDDLTENVHYKSAGAAALRMLLYEELLVAESEEEKLAIEFEAYLRWPFNTTRNGYWKETSGMTEDEITAWKETKRRVREQCEGLERREESEEGAGTSKNVECQVQRGE